jgi:hypothetical protein
LALPTGGVSLLVSVLAFAVFLTDMLAQVRANARTEAQRAHAERIARDVEKEVARLKETMARVSGPPEPGAEKPLPGIE